MSAEVRPMKTVAESALSASFAAAKSELPGAAAVAAMREALPLAPPPDAAAKAGVAAGAGALLAGLEARRIVFVDGAFVPELSDLAGLEPGLAIGSMAAALAAGAPSIAHLGKVVPGDDVAVALNTAFMGDGAVIRVAA